MINLFLPVFLIFALLQYPDRSANAQTAVMTSKLWGLGGELYDPKFRLPDFSVAGNLNSSVDFSNVIDVTSFGAKPNDDGDDSAAFLAAIANANNAVINIPPGVYKLSKILKIQRSNIVLRGAGPDQTILKFPSLSEIENVSNYIQNSRSIYAFSKGVIWAEGTETGNSTVAKVVEGQVIGANSLKLDSVSGIKVGDRVRLVMFDDAVGDRRTLSASLQSGQPEGRDQYTYLTKTFGARFPLVDFSFKVIGIFGDTVYFDIPLRATVDLKWLPEIRRLQPSVSRVGIEGLTIQFPDMDYAGHLVEAGYNAIYFKEIVDGWISNVKIQNADYGVNLIQRSRYNRVENVTLEAVPTSTVGATPTSTLGKRDFRSQARSACHHGINTSAFSENNLIRNFHFKNYYCAHDLTIEGYASGNVFMDGQLTFGNFDHHKAAPYANLFTNINVGRGGRIYVSSGADRGPAAGMRNTLWNIRSNFAQNASPNRTWMGQNWVAVPSIYPTELPDSNDNWLEVFPTTAAIVPTNIFSAQLQLRNSFIEAEATRNSGILRSYNINYSGWGYIDFLSRGSFIEWSANLNSSSVSSEPAIHTVSVYYSVPTGSPIRSLSMTVNGKSVNLPPLSASVWGQWRISETNVCLTTGSAVIRLEQPTIHTGSQLKFASDNSRGGSAPLSSASNSVSSRNLGVSIDKLVLNKTTQKCSAPLNG